MVRKAIFLSLLALVLLTATSWAFTGERAVSARDKLPMIGGANDPVSNCAGMAPFSRNSLDEPLGDIIQAGTTWYDYQANGTLSRMIGVDNEGRVYVVWMRSLTSTHQPRHVYYNWLDPSMMEFQIPPSGVQVNGGTRAGYTAMTLLQNGWVFPAYHQIHPDDPAGPHSAASIDYGRGPESGAFVPVMVQPFLNRGSSRNLQLIWPKIAVGVDSMLHMVSVESTPSAGQPQWMVYSRGRPVWDEFGYGSTIEWQDVDVYQGQPVKFKFLDSIMTIAPDIACSRTSNRVVIAYANSADDLSNDDESTQINNDLSLFISEDGGLNWNGPQMITNFQQADRECAGGDSMVCNRDTLRLYNDVNVILDHNDNIHCAFPVRGYFYFFPGSGVGPWTLYGFWNGIWYWNDIYNEFTPVASHYYFDEPDSAWRNPGAWQLCDQRPNLVFDSTTGYLYCVYQHYQEREWSDQGWPMSDIYISKSCNLGRAWSVGMNVTRTNGGQDTPPPGSLSERDPTAAQFVTYQDGVGYVHIAYNLDHDAGACIQTPPEGVCTLNEVYYQRVPIDSIPTRPLVNPFWPALMIDSSYYTTLTPADTVGEALCTATPWHPNSAQVRSNLTPQAFQLFQNYPNPFNPVTEIHFDLVKSGPVTLTVFNVLGQNVATLYDGQQLNAGAYRVAFDASDLPSGIYMYRLESQGQTATRKMVLLK